MPTQRPSVRYRWIGTGAALVALAALAPTGDAVERPVKGWEKPVLVSDARAARETSLAINPKNPKQMFICEPSGVPAVQNGQSYYYVTADGGRKWREIDVEAGGTTDTRQAAFEGGDCDVAYDAGGTMYTADTWVGNLSVGSSRNSGETWEGTAVTVGAPIVDRPWLVGGPAGTVYLTYHDVQCCTPSAMWFTKSTDYGKTFSPPVPITTANADGAYTWEGNFVVSRDGRGLHLVYSRRVTGTSTPVQFPEQILLASSEDGGATWTSRLVATIPRETSSIYPSIGMDAAGWLHVAWAAPRPDKGDNPIAYTMSKDKGRTWTAPKPLNPGKTGQAPWVAGGRAGEAAIVWLGSPDPKTDNGSDWYFYWARVRHGKVSTGTTTRDPMWSGPQTAPEFEMVRLDREGRMHIGMSVFVRSNRWAVYYQRESAPPR